MEEQSIILHHYIILMKRLEWVIVVYDKAYLRIDRNFCSIHEEITSITLYTPCNKGVYNLIEVISNEQNK